MNELITELKKRGINCKQNAPLASIMPEPEKFTNPVEIPILIYTGRSACKYVAISDRKVSNIIITAGYPAFNFIINEKTTADIADFIEKYLADGFTSQDLSQLFV